MASQAEITKKDIRNDPVTGAIVENTIGYADGGDSAIDQRNIDQDELQRLGGDTWGKGMGGRRASDAHGNLLPGQADPYNEDITRYREMGARREAALTLDQGQADQSRRLQMGALGHLRNQADGSAPSSAAILSQRANQAAAQQIGAAGIRKGGIGGALVAQSQAGQAAGTAALAANAQTAEQRAGEISRGQAGYAAGAVGAQRQDIGAANANAQLEAKQRALEERRQQTFERLSHDTRGAQIRNGEVAGQISRANDAAAREYDLEEKRQAQAAEDKKRNQALTIGISAFSDPRAKTNTVPMGSLSRLRRSY